MCRSQCVSAEVLLPGQVLKMNCWPRPSGWPAQGSRELQKLPQACELHWEDNGVSLSLGPEAAFACCPLQGGFSSGGAQQASFH